jgi:hypothetical protein
VIGKVKHVVYGSTLFAEGSSEHLCELPKNEQVLLLAEGVDGGGLRWFKVLTRSGQIGEVMFCALGGRSNAL